MKIEYLNQYVAVNIYLVCIALQPGILVVGQTAPAIANSWHFFQAILDKELSGLEKRVLSFLVFLVFLCFCAAYLYGMMFIVYGNNNDQ